MLGERETAMEEIALGEPAPRLEAMGAGANLSSSRMRRDSSSGVRIGSRGGMIGDWRQIRYASITFECMLSKRWRLELRRPGFPTSNVDVPHI